MGSTYRLNIIEEISPNLRKKASSNKESRNLVPHPGSRHHATNPLSPRVFVKADGIVAPQLPDGIVDIRLPFSFPEARTIIASVQLYKRRVPHYSLKQ